MEWQATLDPRQLTLTDSDWTVWLSSNCDSVTWTEFISFICLGSIYEPQLNSVKHLGPCFCFLKERHCHMWITKWDNIAIFYPQWTIDLYESATTISKVLKVIAAIWQIIPNYHVSLAFFCFLDTYQEVIESGLQWITVFWFCANYNTPILLLAESTY